MKREREKKKRKPRCRIFAHERESTEYNKLNSHPVRKKGLE